MEIKSYYTAISPVLGELRWNEAPSDSLLARQLGWEEFLKREWPEQIVETRQGFTALSVKWKNPENQIHFRENFEKFHVIKHELSDVIWELPVCYEPEFGKDLHSLALEHQMTSQQVINLHSSATYRLHFFGFLPGFMYLNGLSKLLHTRRKSVPDRSVEAGSVAIGGSQTGVYPMESPGGWHIIGKCPVRLFDPKSNPSVWAKPGDCIKFEPIDSSEMEELLLNPPFPKKR